jgi:hypothetical protein
MASTLHLEIRMDGAAFVGDDDGAGPEWYDELAHVLGKLARQLAAGAYATTADLPAVLLDSLGNTCGRVTLSTPLDEPPAHTWAQLADQLPTIYTDDGLGLDLKVETEAVRVWISHPDRTDHPFPRTVYVETTADWPAEDDWRDVGYYDADEPGLTPEPLEAKVALIATRTDVARLPTSR